MWAVILGEELGLGGREIENFTVKISVVLKGLGLISCLTVVGDTLGVLGVIIVAFVGNWCFFWVFPLKIFYCWVLIRVLGSICH